MSTPDTTTVSPESIQELQTILMHVKPVLKLNLDTAQYERDHETGGHVAYKVVKDRYHLVETFLNSEDEMVSSHLYPAIAPVVMDLHDATALLDETSKSVIAEQTDAIVANYAENGFSKFSPHGGYPIRPIEKMPSHIPSQRVG